MTATFSVRCPAHFPSVAHSLQSGSHLDNSRGGQMHEVFFEVGGLAWRILGEITKNDTQQCSALTSKQLQLYSFWSRLRAPCQVPWWRAFGICFVVRRVGDSSTMAGVKQRREMRVAGPAVWENSVNCENTVSASLVENMERRIVWIVRSSNCLNWQWLKPMTLLRQMGHVKSPITGPIQSGINKALYAHRLPHN